MLYVSKATFLASSELSYTNFNIRMKGRKTIRYEVFHDLLLPLHCMYIIDRVISCILNICLIKIAIIAYPPMVYSTDILGQFFGTLPLSRHY